MSKTGKRLIEGDNETIADPDTIRTQLGLDIEEAFLEFAAGLRGEVELDQYEIAEERLPAAAGSRRSNRSRK